MRTAEGASDEYMVKLEEDEYAKAVKILTDTYAECPYVKHIQDALDKPDFVWDSLFIENIGLDAVNKWYCNPLKADIQAFKKDNTIYDVENEFHASDMRYTKLQMQSAINDKQRTIDKILNWFPIVGEYLRIEKECFEHGFNEEQTDKLVHGQALNFRGYLQADKRNPRVWAESVTAQIVKKAKGKLQLTIEHSSIVQWIQQQLERSKSEKQKVSNTRGFHLQLLGRQLKASLI